MHYLLTIIEEVPSPAATATGISGYDTIEHLKLRLEGPLNIPHIVAVLSTPAPQPKKPRSDRGVSRGPRKQPNDPALLAP